MLSEHKVVTSVLCLFFIVLFTFVFETNLTVGPRMAGPPVRPGVLGLEVHATCRARAALSVIRMLVLFGALTPNLTDLALFSWTW